MARRGEAGMVSGKKKSSGAWSPERLAAELQKCAAGAGITEAVILADIRDGAPADRRGRLDLVRYTAWLLRQHGYGASRYSEAKRQRIWDKTGGK